MWWVEGPVKAPGMYFALGAGGHVIAVARNDNMVYVMRVNTYVGDRVRQSETLELISRIRAAKISEPKSNAQLVNLEATSETKEFLSMNDETLSKYARDYNFNDRIVTVTKTKTGLISNTPTAGTFAIYPLSTTKFFVEDSERFVVFEFDESGTPHRLTLHQTEAVADLYNTISNRGMVVAIQHYKEKNKTNSKFSESELNNLGYQLLGVNKVTAAIEVFKLNSEAYPEAFNTYDSLGEAYMINNQYELAVKNYKRSLELNPNNDNAKVMIKTINETTSMKSK